MGFLRLCLRSESQAVFLLLQRFQAPLSPTPRAPARELDRGLRRQPSNIPQVEQPSRRSDEFSSSKCEVDAADINPALADFEDQRLGAAGLSRRDGLFHENVRVAAGDVVDTVNLRRKERIALFPVFVI